MPGLGKRRSAIAVANETVSILSVCAWLGVSLPDIPDGGSVKVRCPFGKVYHSDQGFSAAFRVYPGTNSAFCFSCSKYFTPVSLAALAWDKDPSATALEILDRVGHRVLSLEEEWERVSTRVEPPDLSALGQALRTYGERIDPEWADRQFEVPMSSVLGRCLSLLDLVRTEEEAVAWLDGCKSVLRKEVARQIQCP